MPLAGLLGGLGLEGTSRQAGAPCPHPYDQVPRRNKSHTGKIICAHFLASVPKERSGLLTFTPDEAGKRGLSKSGLYRAVRAGRYDRIARGLYLASNSPIADWDWLEAASRRPDATICLTSALALHDLTDAVPAALDVAIPRGARVPATNRAIRWHLFAAATFTLGRSEIPIPRTTKAIGIFSPERCIVDAYRLRGQLGYELGRDALREWLRRGGKPAALVAIAAQLPRAQRPLMDALQALG